jgi:micrococcal nuclease
MKKAQWFSMLMIIPLLAGCELSSRVAAAEKAFMAAPEESTPTATAIAGTGCIPDMSNVEVAQVVRVIDGDSIEVSLNGEKIQVRYIGINTPEYYSEERSAAIKATYANEDLVEGKTIYMYKDQSNTDRYGRLLRYVLTDDTFVNLKLVQRRLCGSEEIPAGHCLSQAV